jgi:hypothetical protein
VSGALAEVDLERGRRSVVDHDDAIQMLKAITTAFDEHDLDGILPHFAADAVFEGPRGPDPWGQRFVGAEAIRDAFAPLLQDPRHPVSADEHFVDKPRGIEWTLSGDDRGTAIEVR